MQSLILIAAMIVLGAVSHQWLPWWSIWVVGMLIGLFVGQVGAIRSFFIGFAGAALLWGAYAFWLNWQNGGIMAERIGTLFGGLSPLTMVILTAWVGGMFGGLGVLCTYFARSLFQRSLSVDSLK